MFYERVPDPLQQRSLHEGLPVEEIMPGIIPPASRKLAPVMVRWLLDRHLEQILHARDLASAEEQFEHRGMGPGRPISPPAIAFADLSGYTRLTQAVGDQEAARVAVRLGELADQVAREHGGRLVKLLGDGALLRFPDPTTAVTAALGLVERAAHADLPPVYLGVHAGPLIVRDGDVYGHTVNVASRVAGAAGPGEVAVTREVLDHLAVDQFAIEARGPHVLKGLTSPIDLTRINARRA